MDWHLTLLAAAILLDMLIGDPDWLWRRTPHPVVYFGHMIIFFEKWLNDPDLDATTQKIFGIFNCILLVGLTAVLGLSIHIFLMGFGWWGFAIEALIIAIFIAQKSMVDHVSRVHEPLQLGDLAGARHAVSMIVGRDPNQLNAAGIARASIESLSENFSDGTLAPIFWYALLGLPGLFAYKMLNTLDSMIGHKTEKYQHFGWASAKLDDLANWIPARLSALLIAAAALIVNGLPAAQQALGTAFQDAKLHRSPNAGWPESAMAGALNIALAGPRQYASYSVDDPYMNAGGRHDIGPQEIKVALKIFWWACMVELMVIAALALVAYVA